ncbi:hypothetical protein SAMN02745216_02786 [Desulfatibacillum alkenivorans DSM 16219]|uniref:Alginate export n=1 Tax=Desulfatibacillum alkenivorans DSM 16219 TaxID=1121393 RepID=A0A1M6PBW4_9BACT|nr:hypothetical protein SAMN02745216_02786 [Desulfatibacillum alkenivorans DSM 16219]
MRLTRTLCIICCLLWIAALPCQSASPDVEAKWGGHLRAQGSSSWYGKPHVLEYVGDTGPLADGGFDGRLNGSLFAGEHLTLEAQYQAAFTGGESRRQIWRLAQGFPTAQSLAAGAPSDEHRLFSLTGVLEENEDCLLYHRLDRLSATYAGDRMTVRAGRQALTWGNGLIFNPMDLLNPFSPSDVVRDYKTGDDMLVLQGWAGPFSDLQLAYVPRKNVCTGDVSGSESSIAGKAKFSAFGSDWDVMAARHYKDAVAGFGMVRYVLNAAWRMDFTITALGGDFSDSDFSAVTNLDYSWIWGGHNFYGLCELYYNGFGRNDPWDSLMDPDLLIRLDRGEIYTLGRWYASGQLQFEAHPLVNLFLSTIINLDDGSLLIQPRISWDALSSFNILVGTDIPAGSGNTEFGGLDEPFTGKSMGSPVKAYLLGTWYF